MAESKPFSEYKQKGKTLQAGFNWLREQLKKTGCEMTVSAWRDIRLPEFLWLALILDKLEPARKYEALRSLAAKWVPPAQDRLEDRLSVVSHSFLARLPEKTASFLIGQIIEAAGEPAFLRPLALLDELPGIDLWRKALPSPNNDDWIVLGRVIEMSGDFHSDIATDISWFLNIAAMAIGAIEESEPMRAQCDAKRNGYPANRQSEGGFFRTMELQERQHHESKWPELFWKSVFQKFPAQGARLDSGDPRPTPFVVDQLIAAYFGALHRHFMITRISSVDPVHDVVFGICLHSVSVAFEIVNSRSHNRVLGLFGLRAICEGTINLAYLLKKSDLTLWSRYRDYGYGKARLILEKAPKSDDAIYDQDWLRAFAGEEKAKDLVDIELGDWSCENLRSRAIVASAKEIYDLFYDYTSSVSHVEWLGVNLVAYTWDLNPFHRMMHVPRLAPVVLPSALPSIVRLLNTQASMINTVFPGFEFRLPEHRLEGPD
jgi:hypothetical protein